MARADVARPRLVVVVLLVVVGLPLSPMVVSGRWGWWEAWVYAAISSGGFVVSRALAARRHPGLLAERANYLRNEGTAAWDRVLSPVTAFGTVAILVVAGLDARLGWSDGFPFALEAAGLALILAGYVLGSWALIENAWFSGTVRVQAERGHAVVDSGPYAWVRHPGYLGTLVASAGLPLLLGSPWAFVPTAALATAVVLRTVLEDRFLRDNLQGYREYATRVRHRLLPRVW